MTSSDNSGASAVASVGKAFFANPSADLFGYGVVVNEPGGFVLAHEIGHCLGLPHSPNSFDAKGAVIDGIPYTSFCMLPFPDDMLGLDLTTEAGNLMENGLPNSRAALPDRWLSKSQVNRARLTITSRRCPFAKVMNEALDQPEQPFLDDITGPFAMETFPIDRHPLYTKQEREGKSRAPRVRIAQVE